MHMRCNACQKRIIKDGCRCKDCEDICRKPSPDGNTCSQYSGKHIKPGKSVETDWTAILDIKNMSEREMFGMLSALFDEIFIRATQNSLEKRKIEILLSQSEKRHRSPPDDICYVEQAALRPGERWKGDNAAEKKPKNPIKEKEIEK